MNNDVFFRYGVVCEPRPITLVLLSFYSRGATWKLPFPDHLLTVPYHPKIDGTRLCDKEEGKAWRSLNPRNLPSSKRICDQIPQFLMASGFSGDETAPFFGFLGAAAALVFSCMGAAYGTAKSGVGVASMGVMRPELVMKSIVPVVMAGVLGIYGLIIAVIISTGINPKAKSYYLFDGYAHLSSGLACGLAGLSAGMAIGIVGDAGVRANAQQPKLFVGMILILIFAEALALYGLIVGIILSSRAGQSRAD
ncbi:hypothetical protein GH714_034443 [Hevea brasiliensis]|nr:hypothetical protein GH714_034443 [Hevea brasiliensis]